MTSDKENNIKQIIQNILDNKENPYLNEDFFDKIGIKNIDLSTLPIDSDLGDVLCIPDKVFCKSVVPFIPIVGGIISGRNNLLRSKIKKKKKLEDILLEFAEEEKFSLYLNKLIIEKNFSIPEVIQSSNINKSYFYKILRGDKIPSRDKIIQISFALKLNIEETTNLLTKCNYILYGKNKRDIIILYCMEHNMSLIETNHILLSFEQEGLI